MEKIGEHLICIGERIKELEENFNKTDDQEIKDCCKNSLDWIKRKLLSDLSENLLFSY